MSETNLVKMPVAVPAAQPITASAMERTLLQGDLAQLKPEERVQYYRAVCDSLGLNPLTRPFEYIQLNGKLQLYAKRECTEQLRMLHNVSLTIVDRQCAEDCYIVTARATMPTGRQDESTGAVAIGGLKGEARANALMKAETKAKRRVTLAICGLAFLDEHEVDSVRGAYHVPVDDKTGEIPEPAPGPDLHADIAANAPKETKASRKSTTPFNALEYFGEIKKRFKAIDAVFVYYKILAKYGKEKSNQFAASEIQQARNCWKEMQLVVSDLEVLPIVEERPDPVPLSAGKMVRQGGKYWIVAVAEDGSRDWIEAV